MRAGPAPAMPRLSEVMNLAEVICVGVIGKPVNAASFSQAAAGSISAATTGAAAPAAQTLRTSEPTMTPERRRISFAAFGSPRACRPHANPSQGHVRR